MGMSGVSEASAAERENGTRQIVRTIMAVGLLGVAACVYDYAVAYHNGTLMPVYDGLLVFIATALLVFVVASRFGYVARADSAVAAIFLVLSGFLVALFGHSLIFSQTSDVLARHMGWVTAILIIPFLTIERAKARRLGALLVGATGALIVTHIVLVGANPLTDPACVDMIVFLLSLVAAFLLLDGFAMFREAAIKYHARADAFEETAAMMKKNADEAEAAREEAEKSIVLRETFLATMSHELRTPLNAIIGFAEVMKSDVLGDRAVDQYRAYATDIHQSGEHVLGLINQLLEYSRIKSGTYELDLRPLVLEDVATQVRRMCARTAEEKHVTLVADWDDAAETWVTGDHHALVQIALNLVGNALKFTAPGGTVTLAIHNDLPGHASLCVSDTGIGIPKAKLRDVQLPFVRMGDTTLASETGTGLGLAIVTTLCQALGARFLIDSEEGKGTDCRIVLPGAKAESRLLAVPAAV